MSAVVSIEDEEHPACRERLLEELESLPEEETLTVRADHDVEPVLYQYQEESNRTLNWSYQSEGPEEWELTVQKVNGKSDAEEVDVREIPPQDRHGLLLETYDELSVGSAFVLVNDHDPKPLFFEFKSIHGDTYDWEYLTKEQDEYRVRITKNAESEPLPEEASTRVDVRLIPPHDRHATIFHRFDLLAEGDAMEIVADHDPEPLYHQLIDAHGDESIDWDYLKQEPREVRVLLTKAESVESDTAESEGTAGDSSTGKDLEELDVRSYEPQKRHDLVFENYRSLDAGDAFVLVNDHDPKPLYYQMQEEMDGAVRWEYRQQDEGEWKVLIGKE